MQPAPRASEPHVYGYALAVAFFVAALALREALHAAFTSNPFFTPFYPALLAATYFGGLGPGVLALGLSLVVGGQRWIAGGGAAVGPDWAYLLGAGCAMSLIVMTGALLHRRSLRAEELAASLRRQADALVRTAQRREGHLRELRADLETLRQRVLRRSARLAAEATPRVTSPAPPVPSVRRVLVVEDCRESSESLVALIRRRGRDARVAHDGPGALEALEGFAPELVLMDVHLPGMEAAQLVGALRRWLPGARIVAMDGGRGALAGGAHAAPKRVFDGKVAKPVTADVLARLLGPPPGGCEDDRAGAP